MKLNRAREANPWVSSCRPGAFIDTSALCGQPIGLVGDQLAQVQQQFQAAVLQAGPAANGAYIGNTLQANNDNGIALFAPDYKTPRSVQMNIGFQRELGKGVVLSADYLRNVATHTLLLVDVNHVGDVRFFNKTNALACNSMTYHSGLLGDPAIRVQVLADYRQRHRGRSRHSGICLRKGLIRQTTSVAEGPVPLLHSPVRTRFSARIKCYSRRADRFTTALTPRSRRT